MIIGYRTYRLNIDKGQPKLQSTAAEYIWKPGKNKATHIKHKPFTWVIDLCSDIRDKHEIAQGYSSHCGFWAYNKPTFARDHASQRSTNVTVAAVLGWGNYTIGTAGWRCEYSKIIALSHAMWDEMEALSDYYKVPLVTFKGLTEFASHFGVTPDQLDVKYDTKLLEKKSLATGGLIGQSPIGATWSPFSWSGNYNYINYNRINLGLSPASISTPTWSSKDDDRPECCTVSMVPNQIEAAMTASIQNFAQYTITWQCQQCSNIYHTFGSRIPKEFLSAVKKESTERNK